MMTHSGQKNAILCMIMRITLEVNQKRIYQASRGFSAVAELLVVTGTSRWFFHRGSRVLCLLHDTG